MITSRLTRPLAWLLLAAIIFVTISPIGLRPHTMTSVNADRGLAYAVTGFLFALGYPKQWKLVALLLIFGALAIEFLQYLSPTRHARLHDAVIKAAGAMLGILTGRAAYRRGQMKQRIEAVPLSKPQTGAAAGALD
ncbi:VanZ-like protein [Rhizobium etli 8C-3]|uniref:VanZ like protein n=2 Tax=Rhizobium TaxID=379 RepID=A0A4R3Q1N1_9HYPH|nr:MULTISPECIES: VanZ family protein [Rhizobium]APO74540.1 VanZ-like protein [Rhizobium etli 8C-3]TCU14960.1 VanZ like protein [Rhizobium azibense]TCU31369.1 VanZ like protein [Rhizobium azibense]